MRPKPGDRIIAVQHLKEALRNAPYRPQPMWLYEVVVWPTVKAFHPRGLTGDHISLLRGPDVTYERLPNRTDFPYDVISGLITYFTADQAREQGLLK